MTGAFDWACNWIFDWASERASERANERASEYARERGPLLELAAKALPTEGWLAALHRSLRAAQSPAPTTLRPVSFHSQPMSSSVPTKL